MSPLELKWHSMGAADPPLVHRRNPAAASTKLTPASSIFIWSGRPLVPLLPLLSYLYILRLYKRGVEVGSSTVMWPTGLAEEGVSGAIHWGMRRWWNLVSWRCFGHSGDHLAALQRAWTSKVIETMTHPMRWLREGRVGGEMEGRGERAREGEG